MNKKILMFFIVSASYMLNPMTSSATQALTKKSGAGSWFSSPHSQQVNPLNLMMPGLAMPTGVSYFKPTKQRVATQSAQTGTAQIAAWQKEVAGWSPTTKNWQDKMKQIILDLKKLTLSPDEKQKFITFLKQQKARLSNQSPAASKPKAPIKEDKDGSSIENTNSLANIQKSVIAKFIEHGMGLFGFGLLPQAKKRAEQIAREEESPQKLFDLIQGFNEKEQEDILNAWVIGWKANLAKHSETREQLAKFKKQLTLMLEHMKKTLPKSYETILTSHDYKTDSLHHHAVKVSVLDAQEASADKVAPVHSDGNVQVYHKNASWSDFIFAEALNYVKGEISAALFGGSTHKSA